MKGLNRNHVFVGAAAIVVVIGILFVTAIAQQSGEISAPPSLPAVFYGKLLVGDTQIKDGLKVEAMVSGKSCGQPSQTENGLYVSVVRANDPLTPGCADEGDTVEILVNGRRITTGTWSSGAIVNKDIRLPGSQKPFFDTAK